MGGSDIEDWARSPEGARKLRYSASSVVSAVSGQATLAVGFGVLRWPAALANLFGFSIAVLVSYQLNRSWVWRRDGRSDVLREIVPFALLAVTGLLLSSLAVALAAERAAQLSLGQAARTVLVMTASMVSVVAVWAVRFLVLDRLVFGDGAGAGRR